MIKSRLDLYRPTDEIIEEDPAYQGYNIDDLREDAKKLGKILYGQPEGQDQPNIFSIGGLMQGLARPSQVVQEFLTPGGDKADRERLKQTYQEQNEREA